MPRFDDPDIRLLKRASLNEKKTSLYLMTDSGGGVDQRTSEVAVDVGDEGEAVVLVLSLQHAGLGSGKRHKSSKQPHLLVPSRP